MVSVEVELTKDGELVYKHGLREWVDKKNDHKKIIKSAVLLCGRLPEGYYQFPIEYISQLYHIKDYDISNFKIVLIKHPRNKWQMMWIKLFYPNMSDNIVILNPGESLFFYYCIPTGRSFGRQLYPMMIQLELRWMNQQIIKNLNLVDNIKNKMVLIKRNYSRTLKNWNELKKICEKYCKKFDLELDVFDDSADLGSVNEQLIRFNSAKIIIGSHGAGFTNLIGCGESTYFIEIKQSDRVHLSGIGEDPPTFGKLAEILKIHYQSVSSLNQIANLEQVESSLKKTLSISDINLENKKC
jgi:hypothetical protein